jgi:hypothetical protein
MIKITVILLGLLLVGACALPASHIRDVASADITRHGEGIAALVIGAAFVLVVIPGLLNWRRT